MVITLTAEEKVRRGICDLQKPQPFFAHLSMHMRPRIMPDNSPFKTIGVSPQGHLYYHPEFVDTVKSADMPGLICHETLHIALQHPFQKRHCRPILANIAQDVSVNMIVKKSGMTLPETKGTINVKTDTDTSDFTLDGAKIHVTNVTEKSWKLVYGDIIEQLIKQGKNPDDVENKLRGNQGSPNGSGMDWHEDPGDGEGMSEAEMEREAHNWQKNLANAATYAKQQGKLPAGMQRLMDELLKPRVSWKSLLMKYLRQHLNPTDWSYHKPGRKSHALDVFLPTVIKEGCSVEVICDTSGSIGNDTLKEFLTEIVAIARAMPDLEMWVTFVDAAVHTRYKIDSGEFAKILAMKAEGGGGTSMEAGLDYVKENNPAVPVTVVLTDGYDSWRRTKTDYPFDVIWCITRDGISDLSVIPYGQKVKMDG